MYINRAVLLSLLKMNSFDKHLYSRDIDNVMLYAISKNIKDITLKEENTLLLDRDWDLLLEYLTNMLNVYQKLVVLEKKVLFLNAKRNKLLKEFQDIFIKFLTHIFNDREAIKLLHSIKTLDELSLNIFDKVEIDSCSLYYKKLKKSLLYNLSNNAKDSNIQSVDFILKIKSSENFLKILIFKDFIGNMADRLYLLMQEDKNTSKKYSKLYVTLLRGFVYIERNLISL